MAEASREIVKVVVKTDMPGRGGRRNTRNGVEDGEEGLASAQMGGPGGIRF